MKSNKIRTSVQVDPDLFSDFKIQTISTKITLQKLTERAMFLFLTNVDFQKQIKNTINIKFKK